MSGSQLKAEVARGAYPGNTSIISTSKIGTTQHQPMTRFDDRPQVIHNQGLLGSTYGSAMQQPGLMMREPSNLYEYDLDVSPPTDFDALFSGSSFQSTAVTGASSTHPPNSKAFKLLGMNDPNNLVYENRGFSRNVHFDITQLPDDLEGVETIDQDEFYASKRRGAWSYIQETIAHVPKKSKSKLVTVSKINKNSRWLEWSEKMRMENKIRKEQFLKMQEQAAKENIPLFIKKARKESHRFGNNNNAEVAEDPLNKLMQSNPPPAAPPNTTKKTGFKSLFKKQVVVAKYTEAEWMKLHEYWEHPLFGRLRPCGYIIALIAMLSVIAPVVSTRWTTFYVDYGVNVTYDLILDEEFLLDKEINCSILTTNDTCYTMEFHSRIEHHGFWFNCSDNLTSFTGFNDPFCEKLDRKEWQSAIIGLLLFSLAFGFLATVLTTCGICSFSLATKVYYYHSAGEIYFVSGLCATIGLVSYPVVLEMSKNTPLHEYGLGYYLAWGMPLCYFISAFCMTLDDMIHSLSNDCCLSCRGKSQLPAAKPV